MPIYEYRCKACDHETEVLQKMSDKPLRKCPECGRLQLKRLISAPSFRLKGGGWYETDFKSDKETRRNIAGDAGHGGATADSSGDTGNGKDKAAETKVASGGSDAAKKPDKQPEKKAGKKDSSSAVA